MKCEDISAFLPLPSEVKVPLGFRLGQGLQKIRLAIAAWMRQSSEPKVFERCDLQGNLYYQVYDPHTQRSAVFGSELEVRYWLEQRYSR